MRGMASGAGRQALALARLAAFFCALRLANTAATDLDAAGLLAADPGLPQQLATVLRAGGGAEAQAHRAAVPMDVQTAALLAMSALVSRAPGTLVICSPWNSLIRDACFRPPRACDGPCTAGRPAC